MANNEFRQFGLQNFPEVLALHRKWSYANYMASCGVDTNDLTDLADKVAFYFQDEPHLEVWRWAERENHNFTARFMRLKKRVSQIAFRMEPAFFCTLTFSDETIANTNEQTRRTYVARFLKSNSADYVANLDYGEQKGREHYHAIVQIPENKLITTDNGFFTFDMTPWSDKGFSNAELIGGIDKGEKQQDKLAKYMTKLARHAMKETALQSRLIYPKDR